MIGRSVTGVLHFLNKTPVDWHSKRQSAVETDAHSSECSLALTCEEEALDLRITLRCLRAPLQSASCMLGDNKITADSSMTLHRKIHERRAALPFHRVREAIAAKIASYYFIDSKDNPADVLSEH